MQARRKLLSSFCEIDSSNADFRPMVTPDMTSRRSRRLYTNRQRQQLTEAYERCSHLNRETRIRLAKTLDLNESDVMTFFRNARRRERRLEKNYDFCPESPGQLPPLYMRSSLRQPSTPVIKNHHQAFSGAHSPDAVLFGRHQSFTSSSPSPAASPQEVSHGSTPKRGEPFSDVITAWMYDGRKEISPIQDKPTKSCAQVVEKWLEMCPTPEFSPDFKLTSTCRTDGTTSFSQKPDVNTPARPGLSSTVSSPDFGSCGSSWSSMSSLQFRYPLPDQSPSLSSPVHNRIQPPDSAVTPDKSSSSTTSSSLDFGSCGSSWSSMSSIHFRYPLPDQSPSLQELQPQASKNHHEPISSQTKSAFTPIRAKPAGFTTCFRPMRGENKMGALFSAMVDVLIPQVLHSTPKEIEASCLRLKSIA